MKVGELLSIDLVKVGLTAKDQKGILEELLTLLEKANKIESKNKQKLLNVLLKREELGSTAIGNGIAIPHGKTDLVDDIVAAFGISKDGVEFNALDGEKVHIFFLQLAPNELVGQYLKGLAKVSRLLRDKQFRNMLLAAENEEQVIRLIEQEEGRF